MGLWEYRYERNHVRTYCGFHSILIFYSQRMDDMEKTDFFGVSGAVKFDKLGNRMSKVVVEQLRSMFESLLKISSTDI